MRVTSVELHQKLGQTIDMARREPVTVTKHDRDHVVILSAEEYNYLRQSARTARLTGSLTAEERALVAAATVPSKAEQKRHLADLARAVEAEREERLKG
jgi:prevent-host-death family protein